MSLGTPNQQWNGQFQNLNVQNVTVTGTATLPGVGYATVAYASTPTFNGTTANVFDMTLTGNVALSTLIGFKGVIVFILRQDATGSRTFAWPSNVFGGTVIGSSPNQITVQSFVCDGTNAYPIGAAGLYP